MTDVKLYAVEFGSMARSTWDPTGWEPAMADPMTWEFDDEERAREFARGIDLRREYREMVLRLGERMMRDAGYYVEVVGWDDEGAEGVAVGYRQYTADDWAREEQEG